MDGKMRKEFCDDPMPVNPLLEKWKAEYPPTPMPNLSQVCDGYSCMWCERCPYGEYWKCPEGDLPAYKEYLEELNQWEKRHPDYLDNVIANILAEAF